MAKTISIPIIFNDGTEGNIVLGYKYYLSVKLPHKTYYDVEKGYMHIDETKEGESYGESWQPTKEEYIEAVKMLNIHYFAGILNIENPFFTLKDMYINKRLRSIKSILNDILFSVDFFTGKRKFNISFNNIKLFQYDRIEVAQKLNCPMFGGTWQKYYTDKKWIQESEKLRGSKIYLT